MMELHPLVDETGQQLPVPSSERAERVDAHVSWQRARRVGYSCTIVLALLVLASFTLSQSPRATTALSRLLGLDAVVASAAASKPVATGRVNTTALMEQALLHGPASSLTKQSMKQSLNQSWPPAKLLHAGEDCWQPCGNVSGDCSWCGLGNACCRSGSSIDPPECQGVIFSTTKWHTCVAPKRLYLLKHASQECLSRCGGRSGYCDWCGAGNACCMEKARSVDAPECRGAYGFRVDSQYRCVATLGLCRFGQVPDGYGGCKAPDVAPSLSFYMYKASAPYWPRQLNLSTDMGSLGGVLWYLHNDVVTDCPRKYGIDRILRFFVTVKPTDALYRQGRMFDSFAEFREGKVADPTFQANHWDKYGYNVGCLRVDSDRSVAHYQDVIWYSLPGRCPSQDFQRKTEGCALAQPGGFCDAPNGTSTCTWTASFAGEVFLDEIAGISNPDLFCNVGGFEYDIRTDEGVGNSFWNGKMNFEACSWRVDEVHKRFARKYPSLNAALDRHPCSYNNQA